MLMMSLSVLVVAGICVLIGLAAIGAAIYLFLASQRSAGGDGIP